MTVDGSRRPSQTGPAATERTVISANQKATPSGLVLSSLQRAAEALTTSGVEVRWDGPGVTSHAELWIDEDAVIAAHNWSYGGLARDHELGVVWTGGAGAADPYFAAHWTQSRPTQP